MAPRASVLVQAHTAPDLRAAVVLRTGLVAALACLSSPALLSAQDVQVRAATRPPEVRLPDPAEFPEWDSAVWVSTKRGLTESYIAARLAAGRGGLDLVELAFQSGRHALAVDLLRAHIDAHPEDDAEALRVMGDHWSHSGPLRAAGMQRTYERLLECVAVIRLRVHDHPREQAAAIAWVLLRVDDSVAETPKVRIDAARRAAFIRQWPGTVAADVADLEGRLTPPVTWRAIDEVEQQARLREGTETGARAWALVASTLANLSVAIDGMPTFRADPTARFLRQHRALRALEARPPEGGMPAAPSLGSSVAMIVPVFGPAGPDDLLNAYRAFTVRWLNRPTLAPADVDALAAGASTSIPWLLEAAGFPASARMDRWFDDVEAAVSRKAEARYLRFRYYVAACAAFSETPRPAMCQRRRAAFAAVEAAGAGRYARLAHGRLATDLYVERRLADARELYLSYAARYPDADYSWVAAVRAGQASQRLGKPRRARQEFRLAAARHAANPYARVLALTFAARLSEALGDQVEALADYRAALGSWDPAYGDSYSMDAVLPERSPWRVTRPMLDARIARLSRAVE